MRNLEKLEENKVEITEVRIFLKEAADKKLKAYAAVTFDNVFVVRNIKVIEGSKGLFVAMPSRKLKEVCPKCHYTNTIKSKFCNECGTVLSQERKRFTMTGPEEDNQQSDHRDIAHPITPDFREYLQKKVLTCYDAEKVKGASYARVA